MSRLRLPAEVRIHDDHTNDLTNPTTVANHQSIDVGRSPASPRGEERRNACEGRRNACEGRRNACEGRRNACEEGRNACEEGRNACDEGRNACQEGGDPGPDHYGARQEGRHSHRQSLGAHRRQAGRGDR
jgi:hypothetical protein